MGFDVELWLFSGVVIGREFREEGDVWDGWVKGVGVFIWIVYGVVGLVDEVVGRLGVVVGVVVLIVGWW